MSMPDEEPEITQELVRELFDYDPRGFLIRRKSRNHHNGDVIGAANNKAKDHHVAVQIGRRFTKAHRIIFLWHHGYLPRQIDHINRVKGDNRIENLRAVTPAENIWNQEHRGVHYSQRDKTWRACIKEHGVATNLGSFRTKDEARAAYVAAREIRNAKIKNQVSEFTRDSERRRALADALEQAMREFIGRFNTGVEIVAYLREGLPNE